jgi:uncharacterized protein YceK
MKAKLLALTGVFLLSGCASLLTAEQESINVTTSNNEPAEVTIDDKTVMTPGMVVVLRDGKDKVARTNTEGCDNATPVEKEIAPVFFGNIILAGLGTFLGSTTDGLTGKMWDYEDTVVVQCAE